MTIELKENERLDDLQRNGLQIIQKTDGFCFGMDAVLLSGFAAVKPGERVLDLGTGTGIIPLLLSAKTEGEHFSALEIQDEIAMGLVKAQVGQTVRVLVESFGRSEGTLSGRLDNNLTVEFAAEPGWMGRYANVHLTGARATVLLGELAD